MKITKRQLRKIIREEKQILLNEIASDDPYASVGGPDPSSQMSDKTAEVAQLIQTVVVDLQDAADNALDDSARIEMKIAVRSLTDALHVLGVVAP